MKNPLHYQISDYDCGPTTVMNAMSFLFEREEIPADLVRNIMIYCMDCYGQDGKPGENGTSRAAMMFLSNWLNSLGKLGLMKISSRYLTGRSVCLGADSALTDALKRGGAAIVRLFYDEWHYVLFTGLEGEDVLVFDPYYVTEPFEGYPDIRIDFDHPFQYNRKIPVSYFNHEELSFYSFGPYNIREAVIIFNDTTCLTADQTIEYYI